MRVLTGTSSEGRPNRQASERRSLSRDVGFPALCCAVFLPTEERKRLATDILQQHGGHFINFQGHLTVENLA